jgi:hypothetical protein
MALKELLRTIPDIWSIENVDKDLELATQLKIDLVFIDGTREDQYCRILSPADTGVVSKTQDTLGTRLPNEWHIEMGLDFISGASNTVQVHVQMCLQEAREQLNLMVRQGGALVEVAPQKVEKELDIYRVNAELSPHYRRRVLDVSKEVLATAQCPKDIRDYVMLLDLWKQVNHTQADIFQYNQELNPRRNGGRSIQSCAFSREHNRRYSEDWRLDCDVDAERCVIKQSEDGQKTWRIKDGENRLFFEGKKFLFFRWGEQSIRVGGKVLDLQLIPLSDNLYLETYLDLSGQPLALGLLTMEPKDKPESADEESEE